MPNPELAMTYPEAKALVEKMYALLASVPQGAWHTYCEEGPYRGTNRREHSVCMFDPKDPHGDNHECVAFAVGEEEAQAKKIATFIAEVHNALPTLLNQIEEHLTDI